MAMEDRFADVGCRSPPFLSFEHKTNDRKGEKNMSRKKTKPEDIQNPEHYFNRYIAKETQSDLRDTKEYYVFFDSLDALAEEGNLERRLASSAEDTFEQHMENTSFYAWIDQIEDERLHAIAEKAPHTPLPLLSESG